MNAIKPHDPRVGSRDDAAATGPAADPGGIHFSLHDLATMHVDADAPSLDILRTMFTPFIVDAAPGDADIHIVKEHEIPAEPSRAEDDYLYDEHSVWISEIDVQVRRDDDFRWTVSGSRELLTTVVPLVDEVMTRKGAAMVHATMVDLDGRGILMPAWGGVGKTSTMAKLMKVPGCRFMGDDWGFLSGDGGLLGYAKPMFIKPHHRSIYPHLFEGARKPLVPTRLSRPIGRLTTIVHPVITKYPRLAAFSRRWSPEHRMVRPERAFPSNEVVTESQLCLSVFVERHEGSTCNLVEKGTDWMLDRIVGNFYSELPVHSHTVLTALTATGLVPMHRRQAQKAAIVEDGLADVPCYLLQVPASWPPDEASDVISSQLIDLAGSTKTPSER